MQIPDLNCLADRIAAHIMESSRVVVFRGAGISTESGIPDFRGRDGIWTLFIINLEEASLDTKAKVVVKAKAGIAMSMVVEKVRNGLSAPKSIW